MGGRRRRRAEDRGGRGGGGGQQEGEEEEEGEGGDARVGPDEQTEAHLDAQARGGDQGGVRRCPTIGRSTWLSSTSVLRASWSSRRSCSCRSVRLSTSSNPRRRTPVTLSCTCAASS